MDDAIAKLDFELHNFEGEYSKVLNYIHSEVDSFTLKNALVQYATTIDMEAAAIAIPANQIGVEGQIAYCLNRGAKLKPASDSRIRKFLSEIKVVLPVDFEWERLPTSSNSKNVLAYVDCYSQIDNAKTRVLRHKLSPRDFSITVKKIVADRANGKAIIAKQLLEHYKELLVASKKDSYVTDWVKPLTTIVDTLNLLVNNRASIRAGAKGAKARKLTNTLAQSDRKGEKAAAKVTYKDEDSDLGIVSVDPTNLIGAEAAVIYNTKNRHCEVYFAEDGKKLSVHGSKITNFNVATSIGKTLRQPETNLPHWNRATTVRRLEVLLGQIRGKSWELTGKFNRNTMILKVL